jgi:hypothetical protein
LRENTAITPNNAAITIMVTVLERTGAGPCHRTGAARRYRHYSHGSGQVLSLPIAIGLAPDAFAMSDQAIALGA